jgi:hypothetical protein
MAESAYAFNIAGIRIGLSLEDSLGPLDPRLYPFWAANDSRPAALTVHVEGNPIPGEPLPTELALHAGPLQAYRLPEGWRLDRPDGRLLADPDFTSCRVWMAYSTDLAAGFSGRPWLLLSLWGYLAHHGGALLHGAVCELDGHCLVFLGRPSVGKTTLSRLVAAAGGSYVTDEYPVFTWQEQATWAHGTPWPGGGGTVTRLSAPLEAVFFLRHAPTNQLRRLDAGEGGRRLLGNAQFFVWDRATVPDTMELLDRTARTLPVYDFGFVPDSSAVACLREVL